jgi:predicted Zn-dependent protease with MMP-like domain
MNKLTRSGFERVIKHALSTLPGAIREKMENIAVVVEDLPPSGLIRKMGLHSPYDLMGLYQGVSLDRRGFYYGNVLPDKITLYQRAIEAHSRCRKEMIQRIRDVVLHEVGHFFGLGDEELYELLSHEKGLEGLDEEC